MLCFWRNTWRPEPAGNRQRPTVDLITQFESFRYFGNRRTKSETSGAYSWAPSDCDPTRPWRGPSYGVCDALQEAAAGTAAPY